MASEIAGGAAGYGAAGGGFAGLASQAGAPQVGGENSKGVLLVIAILLLWLAGLCFFIAFEGSELLRSDSPTTAGSALRSFLAGLSQNIAKTERANAQDGGRQLGPGEQLGL